MDIVKYLARINYSARVSADYESLRRLQAADMLAVPFENLDIVPCHRPIQLDEQALWDKLIVRRQGGFCYELNGMFAWLLREIGFEVTYLNARVFNRDGKPGMDFDHLTLMVRAPGDAPCWLTDVGFGDSFLEPLNLENESEQPQGMRAYKLETTDLGYILWQCDYDQIWRRQYAFDLQSRNFPRDYEAACHYHQTSPNSSFTHQAVVSITTSEGRATLEERKLILTRGGRREERPVVNAAEYTELLHEYFGIVL